MPEHKQNQELGRMELQVNRNAIVVILLGEGASKTVNLINPFLLADGRQRTAAFCCLLTDIHQADRRGSHGKIRN